MTAAPRVAIGGFMLESNAHAPVATEAEFRAAVYAEDGGILEDLARPAPRMPATLCGFWRAMNAGGAWTPVPLVMTSAGASGPVEQGFFERVVDGICRRLRAALPVDAVFLSQHGAATATGESDPDAVVFERVRAIVGPEVPIVATLDLHANVSRRMVAAPDALVVYRRNPHTDMAERGADAAHILRRMLAGTRTARAFAKLPIIPPSVTQNTSEGPYADIIRHAEGLIGGDVLNVSVASGFTSGDTPKAGMSVIVTTAGDAALADRVARDVATRAWADRQRYVPRLTSLEEATARALAVGRDPALPPLLFADVADNPGGGGRGNTMWILEAFHRAGVAGCTVGIVNDPALAAEAHAKGAGARFEARFNRDETQAFSRPFAAPAKVMALSDGTVVGRHGMLQGRTQQLGRSARLRLGGIDVVVVSIRNQLLDPAQIEQVGVDLAQVRSLVVKSRGHFRAGFDERFTPERIVEVDVPGLTTPVLAKAGLVNVPRPIFPLDPDVQWTPPASFAV
ncbi:MAG: M81 family metallopeptidase [Alphaproteobacteria bacterium]|nr:M81 family metallopeptidase [Alphaproteobacteria bacterium]